MNVEGWEQMKKDSIMINNKYNMKYIKKYESHEFEDFTMVDMDLVKELWEDGLTDPQEIKRELDFRELSLSTINQIIRTLLRTNQIKK